MTGGSDISSIMFLRVRSVLDHLQLKFYSTQYDDINIGVPVIFIRERSTNFYCMVHFNQQAVKGRHGKVLISNDTGYVNLVCIHHSNVTLGASLKMTIADFSLLFVLLNNTIPRSLIK